MHRMTPEGSQAFKCQKNPVYTEYSPPRSKLHSVSLYDQSFSKYSVAKNPKWTEWPQNDLNYLTVKSSIHF